MFSSEEKIVLIKLFWKKMEDWKEKERIKKQEERDKKLSKILGD